MSRKRREVVDWHSVRDDVILAVEVPTIIPKEVLRRLGMLGAESASQERATLIGVALSICPSCSDIKSRIKIVTLLGVKFRRRASASCLWPTHACHF